MLTLDGVESTGTILDNDKPSIESIDVAGDDDSVVEGNDLVFNVTLSEQTLSPVEYPLTLPASLDVDISGISFSNGVTLVDGMLNVPIGVTTFNIVLPTVDDTLVEPTETYTLTIDGVDSMGSILDNDKPSITSIEVAGDDDSVVEGNDLVFNITLSEQTLSPVEYPLNLPISPDVDTANISFTNDVTLVDGVLNVPVGVTTFDIVLPTVDDALVEPVETYTLTLDGVSATGSIIDNDNTDPIAENDPEGLDRTIGTVGSEKPGWTFDTNDSDDLIDSVTASYDGSDTGYQVYGSDKLGIDGTSTGGPNEQIQYNRNEGKSEKLTIDLKAPAVGGSFSVTNLYADEGGTDNHEQGKWSAYLGDTLIASDYFSNEEGNAGIFNIDTGGFAFDRIEFEAVEFTDGAARGNDSSDYFLQGVSFDGADAYVFAQGQEVRIPLSEILANDSDPDGHSFSVTSIFGESLGDAYIDGNDVVFELPDEFIGNAQFQYQITDERGGTDTATVSVLINPAPVAVDIIAFEADNNDVTEGDSFIYNVTLDGTTSVKTFFDIAFGAGSDSASANDIDLSSLDFSDEVTYNAVTGELEIPAGVSSFSIELPTVDDNRFENTEDFTLTIGGQSLAGNILDNDDVTLTLTGGGEVSEDAGSVEYVLGLSNPSDVPLTVTLERIDDTTDSGDFTTTTASYNNGSEDVTLDIVNNQIVIPAGVTAVDINVGIVDDDVYEQDEDFSLKVTEPAGLTTNGETGITVGATISDDGEIDGESDGDNDNLAPVIDLDDSEAGTGYLATFTEGDDPIMVVDSDIVIDDDIDVITKAEIKLTNPQASDSLQVVGSLPTGLDVTRATIAGALVLTISGEGSSADYEAALQLLQFDNDSEDPNSVDRNIEITVFDDQGLASNVATSTINVVPVNDPPESEDFSFSVDGNDPVSVVFDTGTGTIEGEGSDHISDIEDDADGKQVKVTITELPVGGTLFYNGVAINQSNVENGDAFDPTHITYQPDSNAQGFVLGTKVIPTDSDLESTRDEFYNWGDKVDGKNRVLELENGDSITISSDKGNLTQYRGDVQANHVGHGLGIGGGHGINEGETLTIDFTQRPATHVELGLDGMGGYFLSGLGGDNESSVTVEVMLSDGKAIDYIPNVQKFTSGNDELFHVLNFSVDDLVGASEGVLITGVSLGTYGAGNWELRYLDTALNDSFKYTAVDSDQGESAVSVVTIIDERDNNAPPTLDLDLSAVGTGFDAIFTEGDEPLTIVDTDITIFDENNVISSAELIFTNPQTGDVFGLNATDNPLLSGIMYTTETLESGAIKITLTGDASAEDYEAAISLVQFENTSQSPSQDDRIIEITTFDDASEPSNTAVSTISVTGVADVTVAAASGFEDSKIDLDISLPAGSAAESIVISNIPTGAKIFDGNSELTVTDNSVSVTPLMLDTLTVQPPEDSDVDFTLLVTGLDALNQEVEAHDLEVVVKPVTDTPILQVSGDEIVASIDFENVTLNRSWRGDVTETELSSNGSVGTWGTNNPGGIVEVGQEGVYLGGNAQDRDNQLFEIEGRRGKDDSLFTEFDGKGGQFYELNFDVAARRVNDSPLKVFLVDEEDNRTELFEFDDSVNRDWNDVQEFFQVPKDGTYRIEFESEQDDSYGALLDNIVLSARSNVGYEDTYIDISDIVANLTDTDGSESLTLLIQGLPQGAIVTNGTQTSIAGANGKVDISDWSNLDDLQIQVADKGTYPLTITATASEGDTTFSPADKSESELIDLIVLEAPTSVEPNTPPLVTDFEFFAPDDTIPLNFADFVTDAEDDVSNDKDSLVEIVGEPEFGQLYFLSGTGERFDLDVGDLVEDTTNIYYDLEVGFDVSALGYNHQGQDPFGNGVEVTGGTYTGDKPHIGVEMEEIAFDGAGAAKQSGFFTKRDDENGQGKETEAKQNEFMSIRFTAGMMTRALVGVGSLTGQFSAAANGNGAAQIFVYLYAGGTLLDETPIVMDNSTIVDHQAVIEVTSTLPFDEMRIMPYNAEGQDAGFVLQSLTVTGGEVVDAFDYRAVDSNGLQSDDTATVNVNIVPNGNVADVEEVDYAVQGGSGVTVIHGTDGDDVLEGGLGNDVLTGGLGNDTFKWGADDLDGSYDVVTDFSQVDGNRDILDLTDVFEGSGETLDDLLDNNNITVTNTADETGTLVNINKDGKSVTIELEGVTGISSLSVPELSQIIIVLDT
ncbi:Ig-like domain-containing protein [Vibrio wakamikoensis]|uniref:Ig-like domain-containing protein n=1 Tax=Vibrio wakamikoensis TaxID=2910251 RepID=UPI003D23B5F3